MSTYKKLVATSFSTDFRDAAEVVEDEIPEPASNEVVIKNKYAAVNATDVNITAGRYDPDAELPLDLGVEAAGVVVETGADVSYLAEGDAVITSTLGGGYREYNVERAGNAIKVPEATPEALSIVVSGLTASIALEEVGRMSHDETVLVTAAAGGTGHYAVQLAKIAGNHVIGTCSTDEKVEFLTQIGCDRPVNYETEDVAEVLTTEYEEGIDVIYESVGGALFDTCVEALARHGRLLSIGYISEYQEGPEADSRERIYTSLIPKSASIRGVFLPHFREHFSTHTKKLMRLQQSGTLDVFIDEREFTGIDSIFDAVEYLHRGENRGKLVVRFLE
jgi:NADPH-dependent curcumin reductase CurA